ncbi:MAG: sel1 repeat family protein [Rhodospirillales bacterium]|nr:MAG: sel1 repeat family protein [Rhodospirillales bacterium]
MTAVPARADFADGLAAYDAGDYEAAYQAWLPLARSGQGDAQAAVADLYLSGLVARSVGPNAQHRNEAAAVWWYQQAARCGHAVAQLNLGELRERGVGARRDRVAGYVWLALAARTGNGWADANRRRLASVLTAPQLAAASRRVEAWSPATDCPR